MKKLTTIFLIGILSLQVYCNAQEELNIDYSVIKEYVTAHSSEFQDLILRFEKNDTLLTQEDRAMIYYGYSFTPEYNGSIDNMMPDCILFRKLAKEEKHEDAYEIGKGILKRNPVSLDMLLDMYSLADMLNKDTVEISNYADRYASLLTMIAITGDGKTEETAFKVICINDEYQLLNILFRVENIKSQSLINQCDMFEFENSQYYNGTQMYFDISRSLDQMSNKLKDK